LIQQPFREFVVRTGGWFGFHATAVLGAAIYLVRTRDWKIALWVLVSLVGVVAGLRFFPRYYFQLLPVIALAGARGLMLVPVRVQTVLLILLLVPVVRFGPRYVQVATQGAQSWSDAALMEDSRNASRLTGRGSLLVWGYRPDVYVFSGAPAATSFLDSQPLTGVVADRHLFSTDVSFPDLALENRRKLIRTRPDFIIDGLGPINPKLAISQYPDLIGWLGDYEVIGRTRMSVVMRRRTESK
jgi:hypothetical protein